MFSCQIFESMARDEETEVCFVDIAYDEIPERHYKESEVSEQKGEKEWKTCKWEETEKRKMITKDRSCREGMRTDMCYFSQTPPAQFGPPAVRLPPLCDERNTNACIHVGEVLSTMLSWHSYASLLANLSGRDGHKKLNY